MTPFASQDLRALLLLLALATAALLGSGGSGTQTVDARRVAVAALVEGGELTASDAATFDQFGVSIDISGDTIVVGAPGDDREGENTLGAAYVFESPGGTWSDMTQTAKLTASDASSETNGDSFGISVAIDGDTIIVGANGDDVNGNFNQGSAYVFEQPGGGWTDMTETAKLTGDPGIATGFGFAVDISGAVAVVGAPTDGDAGAAYVFEGGGGWEGLTPSKFSPSDGTIQDSFGESIAIDGGTIVVGNLATTPVEDRVYVFEMPGGGWTDMSETAVLSPSDGENVDFDNDDDFGVSVAVDGGTVVVGAHLDTIDHPPPDPRGSNENEGSAYVFVRSGSGWANTTETAKLTSSDGGEFDEFGIAVAVQGSTIVVGAYIANVEVSPGVIHESQGAAYLFEMPGGGWEDMHETEKLTSSDGEESDIFGSDVAIEGDTIPISAFGTNGTQGSVYVFRQTGGAGLIWGNNRCSGKIDATDALTVLRVTAGLGQLSQTEPCPDVGVVVDVKDASPHPWGDANCSSSVDSIDALAVLRFTAGLSPLAQTEPCPDVGSNVSLRQ